MKTFKIEIPKGYEIDKEKSTFENIVFKPVGVGYVDLGLPSGTLWADGNEEGYYSYGEAIDTFGENNLPKLSDYADLYCYCKWKWDKEKKGMVVTGPNGNSITLPASGYRSNLSGELKSVGSYGSYWSATPSNCYAFSLYFFDNDLSNISGLCDCDLKFSVRKIKRK